MTAAHVQKHLVLRLYLCPQELARHFPWPNVEFQLQLIKLKRAHVHQTRNSREERSQMTPHPTTRYTLLDCCISSTSSASYLQACKLVLDLLDVPGNGRYRSKIEM
jgi:hypothetical protein